MQAIERNTQWQRMDDGSRVQLAYVSFGKIHRVPRDEAQIRLSREIERRSGNPIPKSIAARPIIDKYETYQATILFTVYHQLAPDKMYFLLQAFGVRANQEEYPLLYRWGPTVVSPDQIGNRHLRNQRGTWRGPVPDAMLETWEFPSPPPESPTVGVRLYPGLIASDQLKELQLSRKRAAILLPNSREWRGRSEAAERLYFQNRI